jgi:hypothetical protein
MKNIDSSYQQVIHRIKSTKRKEKSLNAFSDILSILAVISIGVLIFSLIELIANGDSGFRTALFFVLIGSVLGFAAVRFSPLIMQMLGIRKDQNEYDMALRIGKHYPDVRDTLCNSLQLIADRHSKNISDSLSYAAFDEVQRKTSSLDFDKIIDKGRIKKSGLLLVASVLIAAISFLSFPGSLGASFDRLVNYDKSYLPPAPFEISIEPLDDEKIRGEKTIIKVNFAGDRPEKVFLNIKEEQQDEFSTIELIGDTTNTYEYEISSIKQSIEFFASAPWLSELIETERGYIKVTDRPIVRSLNGKIIFPSYTKLTPRSFNEQSADIQALVGSMVDVQLLANKDLSSAEVVFESKESVYHEEADSTSVLSDTSSNNLIVRDKTAGGKFRVKKSGTYHFRVKDMSGNENMNPITYTLIALEDEFPTISLLEPTYDVQVNEKAMLPIRVAIADDYGFSKLKLYYRLAQSAFTMPDEEFSFIEIPIVSGEITAEIPYIWDLNEVNMTPEDIYEFYLEVSDNDIISGPKSARTQKLAVRLPSLDEVLDLADEKQEDIQQNLEKVLKQAEDVKREMDELNQEMLKQIQQKELDWEEKKKLQDIMKQREEMQKQIDQVQQDLENLTEQLKENDAISQETLKKYQELQELMQQVKSPEFDAMQQRMQQAMENVNPQEMQKMMEEMAFDEEKFKESIERTMKLLKRIQAEQKIDALAKRAEELIKKMEETEKELDNANPNDEDKKKELANKQESMKNDLDKMQNELDELSETMQELEEEELKNDVDNASESLNEEQSQEEMSKAKKNTQKGNMQQSKKNQQNAKKNVQKFAEDMDAMKQKMEQEGVQEAMRKMQKAINDMLEVSEEQEALQKKTQKTNYNSMMFPQLAQQQVALSEALNNVAKSMMELSEKSFAVTPKMGKSLGDAMKQMQQAMDNLGERNSNRASKAQGNSMQSLNEGIGEMQNMMSQMQQQGNGQCDNPGGQGQGQGAGMSPQEMGSQLQQLAQQQMGINKAMQKMGQMPGQGSLSPEQQAEMGRISEEQGQAQQAMEELAQKNRDATGKKLALGNLDKIAEEMKEVLTDMQTGNYDRKSMQKQERILSRLLDASRSVHEKDWEKKRESRTAQQYNRESPAALDLSTQEGKKRALEELLRSIKEGYSKDYEALIRRYFEAIKEGNNPSPN